MDEKPKYVSSWIAGSVVDEIALEAEDPGNDYDLKFLFPLKYGGMDGFQVVWVLKQEVLFMQFRLSEIADIFSKRMRKLNVD